MRIEPALLRAGVEAGSLVHFRPVCGRDELAFCDANAAALPALVEALVASGLDGPVAALPVDDFDRLVAALYQALLGPVAELRLDCTSCKERFEFKITVNEAFPHLAAPPADAPEISLSGGTRLRAVTTGDLSVLTANVAATDLIELALIERGGDDEDAILAALEQLAPLAIDTIETQCPHCGEEQHCLFDLARFFLKCLERERPLILREIHLLARSYGWSLEEILSLPRDTRRQFVALVGNMAPRRMRKAAA